MQALIEELIAWRGRVLDMEYEELEEKALERHVFALISLVSGVMPWKICPCNQLRECEDCRGRGWLTQKQVNASELRVSPDEFLAEQPPTTTSPCGAS